MDAKSKPSIPAASRRFVKWTQEEWAKVIARGKQLYEQTPGVPLTFVIDEAARLVLPKDRQRGRESIAATLALVRRRWGSDAPTGRPRRAASPAKVPKAAIKVAAPGTPEHPVPVVRPFTVEEHFVAAVTGLARPFFEAAGGLADRLELLGERLDGIDRALAAFQLRIERAAAPKPDGKERRPRIVVIGLLPGQAHLIRDEAAGAGVELVFVDKDKSPTFDVGAADGAVVYTRFVGHKHEERLRSQLGRERVLSTSGGLGSLRTAVAAMARRINGAA